MCSDSVLVVWAIALRIRFRHATHTANSQDDEDARMVQGIAPEKAGVELVSRFDESSIRYPYRAAATVENAP